MKVHRRATVIVVLFVVALDVPAVGSSAGGALAVAACEPAYVHGVGEVCRAPSGLYAVTLSDGTVIETHGPDVRTAALADHGTVIDPSDPARDPVCAGDYYQHVLYGRPADVPARTDPGGEIRGIVRRMNAVLNETSLASGGPTADYKVACSAGQIKVDAFVAEEESIDFDQIVDAARAAGFDASNADYTIFYEVSHPTYCGVGSFWIDDRPSEQNANNSGGDYGITYDGCWFGRTPMHENGHNQGAVQPTAPFSDLTGHCLKGRDVMCYTSNLLTVFCPEVIQFDCEFNTYFDSAPEPGEWLANHWNIGSRVNRFIAFGT